MKLQNPWGKYEWKGTSLFIKVVGVITQMFGVSS